MRQIEHLLALGSPDKHLLGAWKGASVRRVQRIADRQTEDFTSRQMQPQFAPEFTGFLERDRANQIERQRRPRQRGQYICCKVLLEPSNFIHNGHDLPPKSETRLPKQDRRFKTHGFLEYWATYNSKFEPKSAPQLLGEIIVALAGVKHKFTGGAFLSHTKCAGRIVTSPAAPHQTGSPRYRA